ncbi:alanine racemase [Allopusillimonas ginsengisoli]|uniref:alanine racemase n=1 Tax=Allopusillimonas ginsengisoli TaxID=453575 RepID=UPI001021003C|nr:alanine racemase [Allopusillimonas ginsengisoli]TEA78404.1 alanine racemase [Allopusillimonas ginsengisoli]
MPRPISASISLSALTHNLNTIRDQYLPEEVPPNLARPGVWAVIKANAYGHGVDNAVRAFAQADGLAMLDLDEAVRCRERGWQKPILMLEGFFEPRDIPVLQQYRLHTTLHCSEQLDMLEAARLSGPPDGAPEHIRLDAFVKLDSGMSRLGFSPSQYRQAFERAQRLQQNGLLDHVGKMTHFARADDNPDITREQVELFNRCTEGLPGPVSVCNSAGTLTPGLWATAHGEQGHWVRPGICLYGASPFAQRSAEQLGLRPAMTLASRIISIREIPPGACVGYGHLFHADKPMRIGVVACGYADGYPRHAATDAPITVDGVRTRVLGRVSMDMLVADLGPVPQARVGSPVVLWGEGGPSVDEVAQAAGTIGYELLCAVAPRVPKFVQQENT